jgi:tetratricopeptide (TPR) repeat protein
MLGMTLLQFEQPKLALPYFQRAVEMKPEDTEARFQYGLSLAGLGLIKEATLEFEQVVESDDSHADAYYNLGVAYAYQENRDKAIEMLDKALDVQADHMLAAHAKKILTEN